MSQGQSTGWLFWARAGVVVVSVAGVVISVMDNATGPGIVCGFCAGYNLASLR